MQRKRLKEWFKTALIALLGISAVVLALHVGLFDEPIRGAMWGNAQDPSPAVVGSMSPAARPTGMMANLGPDAYRGHRTDEGAGGVFGNNLLGLYDLFAGSLGEALGSSGPSEPVSGEEWERALSDLGVFFHYDLELPGAVLAGWMGTETGGATGLMQRIVLSARGDMVYLYYMGRDREPRRSGTAVRGETLRETLRTLEPNGAGYGFQQGAWMGTDPYAILLADYSGIPALRSEGAMGAVFGQLDGILERLGMNPALARYMAEEGGRTIVQDATTLRLSDTGLISWHCLGENPRISVRGEGQPTLSEAIERANEIAQILSSVSDAASIYLTSWSEAEGQFVLQFGYYFGGIPIWTEEPAAVIVIDGGRVREFALFTRTFWRTGQFVSVIPELQAVAAMGGAPLALTYVEAESPEGEQAWMHARWLVAPRIGRGDSDG